MTLLKSLAKPPFNLTSADIAWVTKTLNSLSAEDKVRQLFVHLSIGDDPAAITSLGKARPGGLHRFMGPDLETAWKATRQFMEMCEVPPFISGDIEGGGHGSPAMLQFPNNLGLAAANDPDLSRRLLNAMCEEATALGFNWSFTPCIDINHATESAIVGTRSYGSNQKRIAAQAKVHVDVLQSHGIAATAKHWPGEGFDARDQHLVTTVNPLSMPQWESTFGKLYRGLIKQGIWTVMSAHIALPAYMKKKRIKNGLEQLRPASLSKLLNENLLRGDLGFNGLIVSDATPMAGLRSWSSREQHVPEVIQNGCDVFLFCPDPETDLKFMMQGLRDGRLSEERLEEAVTRILALKAALGLHTKSIDDRVKPLAELREIVKSHRHTMVADEAAGKSITLVKDVRKMLPIAPAKHKRITIIDRGAPNFFGGPRREMTALREALQQRGFEVRAYDPEVLPNPANTDLLIYVFATESALTLSHIHIDWVAEHQSFHESMARFWHDVPTVMISFGHPYYLRDAPRVPTYINAYSTIPAVQKAVVERLCGEEKFTGSSPVDAFAGAPDARY